MRAFLTQVGIQLRMDCRDRSTLLVYYLVPLGFYAMVGTVFASVNPETQAVLSASMSIFAITMGALIGIPPALVKLRQTGVLRAYKTSGIPSNSVLWSVGISAFIHLSIVSLIITFSAPPLLGAQIPESWVGYFAAQISLLFASIALGLLLGIVSKTQAEAIMFSQAVFIPSLMLSGIMFPAMLLPKLLRYLGQILPATHGMQVFYGLGYGHLAERSPLLSLLLVLAMGVAAVAVAVRKFNQITEVR